jgi:hypothetical protein
MKEIQNIEMHVSHACNLACDSCSHYSNQGHKGLLNVETACEWMRPWSDRLQPSKFTLLGGEPATNMLLAEIVTAVREMWPFAHLRLVTNGFLLYRQTKLATALARAGNAGIYVSIHHSSEEYQNRLVPVRDLLDKWRSEHGIYSEFFDSYNNWTRRYEGKGSNMQPFKDQNPSASWRNCPARYCPQLHMGNLWKCGPIAYLGMQHEKYGLSQDWQQYLQYEGLQPNCTDQELDTFFDTGAIPECGMCPASPQAFALGTPLLGLRTI